MAYDIELDSMSIYTHLIHQGDRNNVPDKDFSKRSSMKTLTFDLEYYSMSPHTPYLQANFYLFNFFLEGGVNDCACLDRGGEIKDQNWISMRHSPLT